MTALAQTLRSSPVVDDMTLDAIADAMARASVYSESAAQFAALRDSKGMAFAIQSAASCIYAAAGFLDGAATVSSRQGGRAA